MIFQVKIFDGLLNHALNLRSSDTFDQGIELESLLNAEHREDCIVLWAIADQFTHLLELLLHVVTLNLDLASCGSDLSRQALECG